MAGEVAQTLDKAKDSALAGGDAVLDQVQHFLDFTLLRVSGIQLTVGAVIGAFLVLLGAVLLSKMAQRALARYAQSRSAVNRSTIYTLSRLTHYALLVIGALFALGIAGIPISRFAVFAGAIGVGLGFGLQAIFSNFISGLILLFDKSLKVGDFVELESGVHGEVYDINIRATTVVTNDNIDILVPNSEFVTGRVVNWTHREVSRRLRIPFGVAYGTDKELVKKAALEAATEVPFTLTQEGKRKPQVWLTAFGDSSLNFELVVWLSADATKRPGAVSAAYNWALETALCKHDIEIPFPQRDLHVRSWFGKTDSDGVDEAQRVTASRRGSELPAHERERLAENDAAHDVKREENIGADAKSTPAANDDEPGDENPSGRR